MKNSLITRLTALLTALLLIIVCVPNFAEAAGNDGVTLCLHYDRPDDNYDGWSVWFWVEGSDAADVPLQEENGEMVARFSVPEGASSVGFIVKQPNWAAKDVDKDQFVDVAYIQEKSNCNSLHHFQVRSFILMKFHTITAL